MPLYFAYGSNADPDTFAAGCGFRPARAPLAIAGLSGQRLVFRRGGLEDLETAPAQSVCGVIFDVTELDDLAQDAQDAISGLQAQVKVAQNALDTLNDIKAAVSVAAPMLSAAAAIASGNFMGAAPQVVALGNAIASTMRGVGAG
jgi:hypothetical protein